MTVTEAVLTTLANAERIATIATQTRAGRKEARRIARLEQYTLAGGKRCACCYQTKPVSAYGVCNPRADGLQANCKACNSLQVTAMKQGGRVMWHQIRDALRTQAAASQAPQNN